MPTLIAGFSSFPGVSRNPTEDLVDALRSKNGSGPAFRAVTLPVEWEGSWPALSNAIEENAPDTVLLFGLHRRAERLRVERLARNRRELGHADAAGAFPSGPAVLDGPETLPARLPWLAVAGALREAGAPFEWSNDAGGYLCNDTFYRLAHHAPQRGVERFGFFHVPFSDESVAEVADIENMPGVFCSMPASTLRRAALALIDGLARV